MEAALEGFDSILGAGSTWYTEPFAERARKRMLRKASTSYPGVMSVNSREITSFAYPVRMRNTKHRHEGVISKSHEVPR